MPCLPIILFNFPWATSNIFFHNCPEQQQQQQQQSDPKDLGSKFPRSKTITGLYQKYFVCGILPCRRINMHPIFMHTSSPI